MVITCARSHAKEIFLSLLIVCSFGLIIALKAHHLTIIREPDRNFSVIQHTFYTERECNSESMCQCVENEMKQRVTGPDEQVGLALREAIMHYTSCVCFCVCVCVGVGVGA